MREPHNIRAVEQMAAPDWMGFICYERSPRFVATRPAYMPCNGIKRVGVFVNPTLDYVALRARELELDMIQLHGSETLDFCAKVKSALQLPIIKAVSISAASDLPAQAVAPDVIDYYLFDTKCSGYGGSGQQFDWSILSHYHSNKPFLLSGGIGPDDAAAISAMSHPRCIGIDLNSRFETAPAIKDTSSLTKFITYIRNHTQSSHII